MIVAGARISSRAVPLAILCVAATVLANCSDNGPGARVELTDRQQSALSTGWQHIGPVGGVAQGNNAFYTGTTTDIEDIGGGRVRMSTLADGVFEWNGSAWVSLMGPSAGCPNCTLNPVNSPPLDCEGLSVNTLATQPASGNTVIVAGTAADAQHNQNHHSANTASGIWRGVWNGSTQRWDWTLVRAPGDVGDVFKVRWSDSNTVHAATQKGYWLSMDAGITWAQLLTGAFSDLVLDPRRSPSVYAAADGVGLLRVTWSQGGGGSFVTVFSPPASAGRAALAASPADPAGDVIYYMPANGGNVQGLWKIVNDTTFSVVNFPAAQLGSQADWDIALAVNPGNPNQITAGATANGGVWGLAQSQDGGATWNPPTGGKLHSDIHGLRWDSTGHLYAVGDGGYFYSSDGGQSWNSNSNTSDMVGLTDFDLQNGGQQFLGTSWDTNYFHSENAGASWSAQGGDGDANHALADPRGNGQYWTTSSDGCCWRTQDWGATFTPCDAVGGPGACPNQWRLAHDKTPGGILYTGVAMDSNGNQVNSIFQSSDSGSTWTKVGATLPSAFTDLAVGKFRSTGAYLYVQSGARIYRGTRLTSSWADVTPPAAMLRGSVNGVLHVIVTHPTLVSTAYMLLSASTQVLATANAGNNWTDISGNLPSNGVKFGARDLAIDPVNNVLYLATSAGVYKGALNGSSWVWTRWTTGLPGSGSQDVQTLRTADKRSSGGSFNVYAGIWGSGIWVRNGGE
jgi:hypothetical protein